MEELKAMFRVCVANKKDGTRCNSPALKGGNFCFQHIGGSLREHTRARSIYKGRELDFLYPGTRQAIQHNLFVVAQAMNDGKLELSMANTYNRIFATCERNLRRFESLYQKSGEEPELLEVPDEAPESEAPSSDGGSLNHDSEHAEPLPKIDVILSGATAGSEVEEPAFSPSSKDADHDSLKPSLSGEHGSPSQAENAEQRKQSPGPAPWALFQTLSPALKALSQALTPNLLYSPRKNGRFSTNSNAATSTTQASHETYRQIRETRRAARQDPLAMPAS